MEGMQRPWRPFVPPHPTPVAEKKKQQKGREKERAMDESWRALIGSVVPRRRSPEQARRNGGSLGAADFRDVFGGPPRSVLLRQFSCAESASASPFPLPRDGTECWLRPPRGDPAQHGGKEERRLPDFSLPAGAGVGSGGKWVVGREGGFYDGMFESGGGDGEGMIRSRTRSWQSKTKSGSSSVVSSEDGGDSVSRPGAPFVDDDSVLSSFASKLRPIIVPSRRRPGGSPSPTVISTGEQNSSWKVSTAPCARPHLLESRFNLEDILTRAKVDGDPYNRPFRRHSPPPAAAVRLEIGQPVAREEDDESGSGSPSSGVFSIYDDIPMATIVPVGAHERTALQELEKVRVVLEEEIEAEGYGTIEIVPGGKAAVDAEGVGAVDEAIAWAKEKFRAAASPSPEETSVGDDEHEQEEQGHVKKVVGGLLSGREEGQIIQ
ncbi:hypothetical protein Taro_004630 [Colocasia esculenta]|uniref:Uncharacterized protein n=1 Tax=Colocasia esculenta TaxID=4460 RepID=A0A843TSA1_COLES|nr:hypothetical protein [Colocasia esculenta]